MDWSRFQQINEEMNWGDKALMVPEFLYELDSFLVYLKQAFFISCGTGGQHAEHSLHYSGRATDVLFVSPRPGSLLDSYTGALRFGFTEVGVYPRWKFNGREVGGLHLGLAGHDPNEAIRRKTWMGVPAENGSQTYIGATAKNFVTYGLLKGVS